MSKRKAWYGRIGGRVMLALQANLVNKTPEQAEETGRRLGLLLMRFSKKHRERCLSNLALAFPEMPQVERAQLTKKVFEHFGRAFADFLVSMRMETEPFLDTMEVEGFEHVDAALERGKGVLIITGHIGNWERSGRLISLRGYPLSVVIRTANDPIVDQVVNSLRSGPGTQVIPRGAAARPILTKLKANELVAILPDQNSDEAFLPFFGQPAGTVLGPGVIHKRTGCAVIPLVCVRKGPMRYHMSFGPPLEPEHVEGGVAGEGMMRAINTFLEATIRQYPDQWLWFHDRWRSARRKQLLKGP